MFYNKHKVDEDLERFRRANMPPEELYRLNQKEALEREQFNKNKPDAKDILALIIAAFSIIGPYVLAFIGLLAIVSVVFGTL